MPTPILILPAALAVAAAVVAVASLDPGRATLGAFAAVLLAAFAMDPLPSAAAVVARVAGALLGGWLVWTAVRSASTRASTRPALGWRGAVAVAVAALVLGWLAASAFGTTVATHVGSEVPSVPGGTLADGSLVARAAAAAAAALLVLAAPSVVLPRDGLRLGLGIVLLIGAAVLLSDALAPGPDDGLELAIAVLVALTGAAVAAVVATMLRTEGDLVLRDVLAREPAVRHRTADDAHPGPAR